MDVDGYRIVNVYKPPSTRLQVSDLPVFTHPVLYAGDFNCLHVNRGYRTSSANGECHVAWANLNGLVPLHDPKDMATFYSGRSNTGTNPDMTFFRVGPDSRVPDRCILEKFPRSQHRPSLFVPPRFALSVLSKPAKLWNFLKANWSHYYALTNKQVCYQQIHRMWIWPTRTSAISSKQHPKILFIAVVEIATYLIGMLIAITSTGHFCSRLKEVTLMGLPLPCSPGSTKNAEIDGPRQFRLLTFCTLAKKHGVY